MGYRLVQEKSEVNWTQNFMNMAQQVYEAVYVLRLGFVCNKSDIMTTRDMMLINRVELIHAHTHLA